MTPLARWACRFVRWLKVNVFKGEDRDLKQGEYSAPKDAVRQALRDAYGTEVGDNYGNIGHWEARDGNRQHGTSSDFPIPGRHSTMIKSAEKLILNGEGVQYLGQGFRDHDGNSITEQTPASWMRANQVG